MVFFALCLLAVSLWVGSFFTQVLLDLSHTGLEEYLQGYTLGVLLYPPSGASLLTEIYLCDACPDHQNYRRAALPALGCACVGGRGGAPHTISSPGQRLF
jgi:hypothetical protein